MYHNRISIISNIKKVSWKKCIYGRSTLFTYNSHRQYVILVPIWHLKVFEINDIKIKLAFLIIIVCCLPGVNALDLLICNMSVINILINMFWRIFPSFFLFNTNYVQIVFSSVFISICRVFLWNENLEIYIVTWSLNFYRLISYHII